jgi:hypothetical protein
MIKRFQRRASSISASIFGPAAALIFLADLGGEGERGKGGDC